MASFKMRYWKDYTYWLYHWFLLKDKKWDLKGGHIFFEHTAQWKVTYFLIICGEKSLKLIRLKGLKFIYTNYTYNITDIGPLGNEI